MSLSMRTCPHCGQQVLVGSTGVCPACRAEIVAPAVHAEDPSIAAKANQPSIVEAPREIVTAPSAEPTESHHASEPHSWVVSSNPFASPQSASNNAQHPISVQLTVVGIVQLLVSSLATLWFSFSLIGSIMVVVSSPQQVAILGIMVVLNVILLIEFIVAITGCIAILLRRSHRLAVVSAVSVVLPPACFLVLPAILGLWLLLLLRRPDARAQFADSAADLPTSTTGSHGQNTRLLLASVALLVINFFAVLGAPFVGMVLLGSAQSAGARASQPSSGFLIAFVIGLFVQGLVGLVGGMAMLMRRNYRLSYAGAAATLLPPLMFYMLPPLIGAWALWTLTRPGVREEFR